MVNKFTPDYTTPAIYKIYRKSKVIADYLLYIEGSQVNLALTFIF